MERLQRPSRSHWVFSPLPFFKCRQLLGVNFNNVVGLQTKYWITSHTCTNKSYPLSYMEGDVQRQDSTFWLFGHGHLGDVWKDKKVKDSSRIKVTNHGFNVLLSWLYKHNLGLPSNTIKNIPSNTKLNVSICVWNRILTCHLLNTQYTLHNAYYFTKIVFETVCII